MGLEYLDLVPQVETPLLSTVTAEGGGYRFPTDMLGPG